MKLRSILIFITSSFLFAAAVPARAPLSFEERVKAQEAIERVYFNHRIWPKDNTRPRPSFETAVRREELEDKVTLYLKCCAALEKFWNRPLTAAQLQAEIKRIAERSKAPRTLGEIFDALGNDPFVIAECLARPILAERLARNLYASEPSFHAEARAAAGEALRGLSRGSLCGDSSGEYSRVLYRLQSGEPGISADFVELPAAEFADLASRTPEEGEISPVIEKDDSFIITRTISKTGSEIDAETLAFPKKSFNQWLSEQSATAFDPGEVNDGLYIPPLPEDACTEGWWENGLLGKVPPMERSSQSVVWTGSEMIIWGGYLNGYLSSGGRYNPATDDWSPTFTGLNCPSPRSGHTAVWTGTEMIVWGGFYSYYSGGYPYNYYLSSGARYDPASDTWTATSTAGVPAGRFLHTAVWTGSEMIVWGGLGASSSYKNDGSRYDPAVDSWTAISSTGAPTVRAYHTAVLTSTEMIVWGGYDGSTYLNTGGRYNLSSNSWSATNTTGPPAGRRYHTAVWTGSEMVVWGGMGSGIGYRNDGGRYDPSANSWSDVQATGAPEARAYHTTVWTGSEMIVWGGYDGTVYLGNGARYAPSANSWTEVSSSGAPVERCLHTAVWTGSEMIVWGGASTGSTMRNDGGRYIPSSDTWLSTDLVPPGTPAARNCHTAVWTGSEMIIWGGGLDYPYYGTGGRYNPATDAWTPTTMTGAPGARQNHTAVWTGSRMIVWGGRQTNILYWNDGGSYDPVFDEWTPVNTVGAPEARAWHTAVWTGAEMIVWGGSNLNTGGRYNPEDDNWNATAATTCPSRSLHTAVWTGTEMIIWGGLSGSSNYLNSGARYNPSSDTWAFVDSYPLLSARDYHSAVWTGTEMIVWGGWNSYYCLSDGGRYNPTSGAWSLTSTTSQPGARRMHTAVWTGSKMIVWGGQNYYTDSRYYPEQGGVYDPATNSWVSTPLEKTPQGRMNNSAVWADGKMIVWGGISGTFLKSGGIFKLPGAPSGLAPPTAYDPEQCTDSGVLIQWSAPSEWGDGGSGTRTFDLLRDGTPIFTNLPENNLAANDNSGANGVSYMYCVRANNGCGQSATSGCLPASDTVLGAPGEVPSTEPGAWSPVSGADSYKLYRGVLAGLPNLRSVTADGCLRFQGYASSCDISADDPSSVTGRLYWYLVTAVSGPCEGTAGEGTGFTRDLSSTGSCM